MLLLEQLYQILLKSVYSSQKLISGLPFQSQLLLLTIQGNKYTSMEYSTI